MAQSEISRTLQSDQAVSRLTTLLSKEAFKSRNTFSRRVCAEFAFLMTAGGRKLRPARRHWLS